MGEGKLEAGVVWDGSERGGGVVRTLPSCAGGCHSQTSAPAGLYSARLFLACPGCGLDWCRNKGRLRWTASEIWRYGLRADQDG